MKPQQKPKEALRSGCLPELKARHAYFDIGTIRAWLDGRRLAWTVPTLKRYMAELIDSGFVQNAGRGWYSGIVDAIELDEEPFKETIFGLSKKFPLLDFACWSTQQVNPYLHHLLGKFVTFVNVPRDAMGAVGDFLRESGCRVFLNPTQAEVKKTFSVEERTVVIRPFLSKTPVMGHAVKMERLLVDLFVELRNLPLMDKKEFHDMAVRVVSSRRVEFSKLVSHAKRRRIDLEVLFGRKNQPSPLWRQTGES